MFFPGMISLIFSNIKNLLIAAVITYAVGATIYGKYAHNKIVEQEQTISEYKIKAEMIKNINDAESIKTLNNNNVSKLANTKLQNVRSINSSNELDFIKQSNCMYKHFGEIDYVCE